VTVLHGFYPVITEGTCSILARDGILERYFQWRFHDINSSLFLVFYSSFFRSPKMLFMIRIEFCMDFSTPELSSIFSGFFSIVYVFNPFNLLTKYSP
jgi:hypothetical protein